MKLLLGKFTLNNKLFNSRTKIIIWILSVIFVSIMLISLFSSNKSQTLATFVVKKSEFVISVTESGELKAASNNKVTSPRSWGRLQIVYLVPEGTVVKEGDVLAQFDKTEAMKRIEDKQVELTGAEMDLNKAKTEQALNKKKKEIEFENTKLSFEASKLNAEKAKFESELVQKQTELDMKKNENSFEIAKQDYESYKYIQQSDLNRVQRRVRQIKQELDNFKKEIDDLSVKAPAPGLVVYEYNWEKGRKVTIGDVVYPYMAIISLPDLSKIQITTSVNEVDVSKVMVGQLVKFRLDAFLEKSFTGKVSSVATIGKSKEGVSGVKIFEVMIDVDGTDPIFKPGMTTSNEIITEIIPNATYVPLESVFEKDNKIFVYKVTGGFNINEVKIGKKNSDFVIIEQGLEPGDKITLRDPTVGSEDDPSSSTAVQIQTEGKPAVDLTPQKKNTQQIKVETVPEVKSEGRKK